MRLGALIVTTGLPQTSGVTALLPEVGSISVGQRMISAFQSAEVNWIALVVGPENKKAERGFSQNGVIFLRCAQDDLDYFTGIKHGLRLMRHHFDRIFVVPGDTCLFLPSTLEKLAASPADIAVPTHRHLNGYPVLLSRAAMDNVLEMDHIKQLKESITSGALTLDQVQVEDSGTLVRSIDSPNRKNLIHKQDKQLTRPVAEVSLCSSAPLFDARLSMLLHLVEEFRSVRDACSLMQISYSTAWNMLNRVEDELGFPLVTRIRGGSSGSGSELTEKGKSMLDAYDRFSEQITRESKTLYKQIFRD